MQIPKLDQEHSLLCQIARLSSSANITNNQLKTIENAVRFNQYELVRDIDDEIAGYVTYAKCNRDTLFSLQRREYDNFFPKFDYEYNDGRLCYILDVVFEKHFSIIQTHKLFREFVKKHKYVFARRKGRLIAYQVRNGRVIKDIVLAKNEVVYFANA